MQRNTGLPKIEGVRHPRLHPRSFPTLGLTVDISGMNIPEAFFVEMEPRMQKAFDAMEALERGAIANPDENRMVGHYWLRNPALAPTQAIREQIEAAVQAVKCFAAKVHAGEVQGEAGKFKNFLLIGIGGSALGPQFVSTALGHPATDKLRPFFFDNTDPDGMERLLRTIGDDLGRTLCVVVSKSGGTKETSNGMKVARAAYERAGLRFERHAVAITREGSELDKLASAGDWLCRFPMWDWVGGRTSELSAVGLFPAALQGFDIDFLLAGAKACDEVTRVTNVRDNPSSQLALAWFLSGNGNGYRSMVVVPYKDGLALFARYLQQLIMESIGKELDSQGNRVNQGICVFGNKGSTDQHSYIQQLRDGVDNVFVTFVEVLKHQDGTPVLVEGSVTSGDYLHGFCLGTCQAIAEKRRGIIRLKVDHLSGFSVGVLIAVFERTVGLYASLVGINAYHQPGVEAGKKGAVDAIELHRRAFEFFKSRRGLALSSDQVAMHLGVPSLLDAVYEICRCMAENRSSGIQELAVGHPPGKLFRSF